MPRHTPETRAKISTARVKFLEAQYNGVAEGRPCARCKKYKARENYNIVSRRLKDGRIRQHLASWCRECKAEYQREVYGPTVGKEELARRARVAYGVRKKRVERDRDRHLPVQPFIDWLRQYPGDLTRLARAAGLHEETLVKMALNGEQRGKSTRESLVDSALQWSEDGTTINDLYPEE